ncbi:MAG: FAD binding domain-containing protein [Saprospiraceae bacterium]|nr:FAD binding domain-containing protein [Saprospiraceae bacterium]
MTLEKTYFRPRSIGEAVRLAAEYETDLRYLAGGTDVMVNKFQETDTSTCLIDLTGIEAMKQTQQKNDHLSIGALVCLDDLKKIPEISAEFPLLLEAVQAVASPVIRKTATLGGNLLCENRCAFFNQSEWWRQAAGFCLKCNGATCLATGGTLNCFSKFASDTAIALVGMDATITVLDKEAEYTVPLEEIYTGDGLDPRKLDKTALIRSIELPIGRGFRSVFKKLRHRETLEFSSLTSVVTIDQIGQVKIVLGGVDPKPVVVIGTIADDKNELIKKAIKKARIVDNDVYSRLYRKEMIGVYLNKSFEELEQADFLSNKLAS